jgi:hypothetical protein
MTIKNSILLLILLSAIAITSCKAVGDIGSAKMLSKKQEKTVMINMGIQNLPDLYFDHYFKYPDNLNELISFTDNHADFQNRKDDIWRDAINYLKSNQRNIRIVSSYGLFVITSCKKVSYNQRDICSLISMQYPGRDYSHFVGIINIFNNQGRNLREIIGTETTDSLISSFKTRVNEMIFQNNFQPKSLSSYESDKSKVIILDFSLRTGLRTYCPMEKISFQDYKYFELLGKLCSEFLNKINADRIVFCSHIYE